MHRNLNVLAALLTGLGALLAHAGTSGAQENPDSRLAALAVTFGLRPHTELTYQPMQEVLSYLRANG